MFLNSNAIATALAMNLAVDDQLAATDIASTSPSRITLMRCSLASMLPVTGRGYRHGRWRRCCRQMHAAGDHRGFLFLTLAVSALLPPRLAPRLQQPALRFYFSS